MTKSAQPLAAALPTYIPIEILPPESNSNRDSVATARAVESRLSGRCALNKLGKIMKILVELE